MHKIQNICIVIKNTYFMPITLRNLWQNLVKAWSKLVLGTLMLSLYYRSSTFFFKLCHMLSWFWKTSMKAGTEEAEEQARHAWKDEVMREETRHEDSQRETCHSIGRILRIVFILWILLRGRASMKRVEGREKETNNNLNTYYSDERIPHTRYSYDCLACQQTSFTLRACFASDVLHDYFLLINDRHSGYPNESSKSHDDSPHSTPYC